MLREIARRRKTLGLTQARLAREAGVSQSLVAKVEAGKADPSYSKAKQVFDSLTRLESEGSLTAADVMHQGVRKARAFDSALKAARLMKRNGLSQLPVVSDEEIVVGGLSDSALLEAIASGADLKETRVESVMGEAFPQVAPATPLKTVLELLKSHSAILVYSKGSVKGIVTKTDALDASK